MASTSFGIILMIIRENNIKLLIFSVLIGFTNALFPVMAKIGRVNQTLFKFLFFWYFTSSLYYLIYIFFKKPIKKSLIKQLRIVFILWKSILLFLIINASALFLLYYSLEFLNSNSFTFLLGSGIIFNIVVSIFWLNERDNLHITLSSILIILIGFTLIRYSLTNVELKGVIYIIGSTFLFAITNYIIKSKFAQPLFGIRIHNSIIGALKSIFLFFLALIALIITNETILSSFSINYYIIIGALVGPFIGYIFVLKVLREFGLNSLVIYKSSEYSFAAIFGIVFFKQYLSLDQILGVILILCGIILYNNYQPA